MTETPMVNAPPDSGREKVMLVGGSDTSKTRALVTLAMMYPDRRVVILDPDDGVKKTLMEFGYTLSTLPNLSLIQVTKDWSAMMALYNQWREVLVEGDWLCFDMLGRFWDLVQGYYSQTVFGKSHAEHLLELKRMSKQTSFNGFDGLTDWPLIKNMHNTELIDDAVLFSRFNVMATTSVGNFSPKEKIPKDGVMGLFASKFGVKPEGEKHNIYRFDTIAFLHQNATNQAYVFNIVKDRGRPFDINTEHSIQGSAFWPVYRELKGIV